MTETKRAERPFPVAIELGRVLSQRGWSITTAESCTGGLVAAAITDVAGSSAWFEQGLITYSNTVKSALLGVPATVFETHGAVSEACVRSMAAGAMSRLPVNLAVAVSGIAGPDGATADKPVGTVWLAWAVRQEPSLTPAITAELHHWAGDRQTVREQAVIAALRGTITRIVTP